MSSLPVVLITGTNSGVGLALAVQMAAKYCVFAAMRGVTAEKRAALDEAASAAGVAANLEVVEIDVCSDASVASGVAAMLEKTGGRCDILVNNAGYSLAGSLEMISMEDIKAQFETNVFGVMRCQRAVLPAMRKQRAGKIINLSSIGGVWGQPFNDAYCAPKFALEGLSESQAAVLRTFGVYVTNVQPGGIKTAFMRNCKMPDVAAMPSEYGAALQSTMAAYAAGGGAAQSAEEVAKSIIDQVVDVAEPPLKVQTNAATAPVFEGQLKDTTGEWGVQAAAKRFL